MSIILGRPFLNAAGVVIDCNGTLSEETTSSSQYQFYWKISTITIGGFEFPLPTIKKKYNIIIVGDVHIPVEVTQCYSKILQFHDIRNGFVNKT